MRSQVASSETTCAWILDELQSILSGFIGGARYGTKIRLPHALIMTFLFRRDLTIKNKIKGIIRLVAEHASNLAAFAAIYKSLLACLKVLSRNLTESQKENQGILRYFGRLLLSTIGKYRCH